MIDVFPVPASPKNTNLYLSDDLIHDCSTFRQERWVEQSLRRSFSRHLPLALNNSILSNLWVLHEGFDSFVWHFLKSLLDNRNRKCLIIDAHSAMDKLKWRWGNVLLCVHIVLFEWSSVSWLEYGKSHVESIDFKQTLRLHLFLHDYCFFVHSSCYFLSGSQMWDECDFITHYSLITWVTRLKYVWFHSMLILRLFKYSFYPYWIVLSPSSKSRNTLDLTSHTL